MGTIPFYITHYKNRRKYIMKTLAYLNRLDGLDDAIVSLKMSKQSVDRQGELEIRDLCYRTIDRLGYYRPDAVDKDIADVSNFIDKVCKYGKEHITLLKFIDMSITVYGLHRAGCDDLDSHAKRFDNRIIRSSTRLSTKNMDKVSEWYEAKIIPTDTALAFLGITLPDTIEHDGVKYVRAVNGYVCDDMKDSNDVKRGLYMLSIPTAFTFKINLAEFAHVVKLRDRNGSAAPELQYVIEQILAQLEARISQFNREFMYEVKN